ncbi:hypothetical protein GCWU000342_01279 [Shuttleworthella satelles DSM 14600]|uniref:Uncharacterized protein n=1 Tax=Shuttleworthella satelles DSM 14600 TaxID=626523 RepID=C4GBH8_9FIRM|nr:hypothetical protein GCWU000342_01279 [Shuttleworthia satelles DSM 14600]
MDISPYRLNWIFPLIASIGYFPLTFQMDISPYRLKWIFPLISSKERISALSHEP